MERNVYINDIASFLPNEPIENDAMEDILGYVNGRRSRSFGMVLRSNGIKTRYYAIDPVTKKITHNNAKMTVEAIQKLLARSNTDLDDVESLSCGTSSPDQLQPAHANMVQGLLSMHPSEATTAAGVCLSGITAMKYAVLNILSSGCKKAIATGSEFASVSFLASNFKSGSEISSDTLKRKPSLIFEKDFLRWMLSDGAGAVLLSDAPNKDRLSLRIDWIDIISYSGELPVCMFAGCNRKEDGTIVGYREVDDPFELINKHFFALKQDTEILDKHIVIKSTDALQEICKKRDLNVDDVNWFLPHYSSEFFRPRLYESLIEKGLEIPYQKWFTNLTSVGNVGSASIYLILEEIFYNQTLKPGDRVLCYVPESARFSFGYMHITVV